MSSDVKFVEGRGGVGGRHDAELVKDFLQSREAAVLQESTKQCCREGGEGGCSTGAKEGNVFCRGLI